MRGSIGALFVAALVVALAGCGGGDRAPSGRSGALKLTVVWPERSRLIPEACNSISATVAGDPMGAKSQLLPRPTSGNSASVTFTGLLPGSVTLHADAYPEANGTGIVQASGSVPATILSGQTTSVTVTMASTIDHVTITPATPSVAVSRTVTLTMTAYDASHNVVLCSPSKVTWHSATPGTVTLTTPGITSDATGVAVGSSLVTVTESESGKSDTTTVTVQQALTCSTPHGIWVGADERIYVTDQTNSRIWRVDDMTGANPVVFGSEGTGTGQFNYPRGIRVDQAGIIYVADAMNDRLVRMDDMTGKNWLSIGPIVGPTETVAYTSGITVDADGRLYIANGGSHTPGGPPVVRMDDMTGTNRIGFGTWGTATKQYGSPRAISVTADGRIYVADIDNNRIVRTDDMSGTNWICYGSYGTGIGKFYQPQGIFVAGDNRIYVSDRLNCRVVRMDDMNGTNWTSFGTSGFESDGPGHLFRPAGIYVDGGGRIYIADQGNGRIVRIDDMNGTNWTTLSIHN